MKLLSQMTEKELKTLCKSLEAEYSENSTVTIKQSDFNNMWASIDRYAKENKRLQEQLNEANEIVRYYDIKEPKYVKDGVVVAKDPAHRYLKKWGVK